MSNNNSFKGGCGCGAVRYKLRNPPLFVHACHCTTCQKGAGSAFSMTTIVLKSDLLFETGEFVSERIPPRRTFCRCADCRELVYKVGDNHPFTALLCTGTFDDVRELTIGAHIWTRDKHSWLTLPAGVPQFEQGYDRETTWPRESLDRLRQAEQQPQGHTETLLSGR